MSESIVIGVDVGGSHITAALVDLESRKMIKDSWIRKSINSGRSAEQIISDWCGTIAKTFNGAQLIECRIGIGIPGPFDYEEGISYIKGQEKYDALYGLNVKELMATCLGIPTENILLMNDAACFLLGEVFGGAGQGYNNVMGVTLGTGLGSSVYKENAAVDAELWNAPFKDSIAEDYLSTRWFARRYQELTGKAIKNVKEIADIAKTDADAQAVFKEFGKNLAQFLNQWMPLESPDAIILGGNISKALRYFESSLKENLLPEFHGVAFVTSALGEEACILGASSLWHSALFIGEAKH